MVGKMTMQTARQPRAETALPPRVRGHLIPNAPPAQAQPRKCGDCPTWPQQPPPVNGSGCCIPVIYWEGEEEEGGDLTVLFKTTLSQPLSDVALCPKAVLPKSFPWDSLDLCSLAFQIIILATGESCAAFKRWFSFPLLPGDHEPIRTCSTSLARETADLCREGTPI